MRRAWDPNAPRRRSDALTPLKSRPGSSHATASSATPPGIHGRTLGRETVPCPAVLSAQGPSDKGCPQRHGRAPIPRRARLFSNGPVPRPSAIPCPGASPAPAPRQCRPSPRGNYRSADQGPSRQGGETNPMTGRFPEVCPGHRTRGPSPLPARQGRPREDRRSNRVLIRPQRKGLPLRHERATTRRWRPGLRTGPRGSRNPSARTAIRDTFAYPVILWRPNTGRNKKGRVC